MSMISNIINQNGIIAPLPRVKTAPVWLFMSGWTANATYMYHFNSWELSTSKVSISSHVFLRKSITQSSFFQSTSLDSLNFEDKIEIAWFTSGFPCLLNNIAFMTNVWKIYLRSSFKALADLSIFNSFSVHGPASLDFNF